MLKEKNKNSLFEDEDDDQISELIYRLKEDLHTFPDQMNSVVEQGAKARVEMEVVKNIKTILQNELLETGLEFRRLIDRRSQVLFLLIGRQSEIRRTRKIDWTRDPLSDQAIWA